MASRESDGQGGELHDGREGGGNREEKCLSVYNQCAALNLPAFMNLWLIHVEV